MKHEGIQKVISIYKAAFGPVYMGKLVYGAVSHI